VQAVTRVPHKSNQGNFLTPVAPNRPAPSAKPAFAAVEIREERPDNDFVDELQPQLSRKWKTLLRQCRSLDGAMSGELNRVEFRQVLSDCEIDITNEGHFQKLWDKHANTSRCPRYMGVRTISYRHFMRHYMLTLKLDECNIKDNHLIAASSNAASGGGITHNSLVVKDPRSMWARQSARKAADPYMRTQPVRGHHTADGVIDLVSSPRVRAKERASRQYHQKQQAQVSIVHGSRTERVPIKRGGRLPTSEPTYEISPALKQQIAAKWKSVRKACQRLDSCRTGCLSTHDVHDVLASFGVIVSIRDVEVLPRKVVGGGSEIMYNKFVKECLK